MKTKATKNICFFFRACCFCLTFIGNCLKYARLREKISAPLALKLNEFKILKNNNFSEAFISAQRAATFTISVHTNSLIIKQSQQKTTKSTKNICFLC